MGGGHHPHIDFDRAASSHALERPLLQHPQQPALQRQRKLADLVEKDRAAVRRLEAPHRPRMRAGERPPLVAEQLALDQRRRQRRAVDLHEGRLLPRPVEVDRPGDQPLARPRLAAEQHRGVDLGRLGHSPLDLGHRLACPEDPVVPVCPGHPRWRPQLPGQTGALQHLGQLGAEHLQRLHVLFGEPTPLVEHLQHPDDVVVPVPDRSSHEVLRAKSGPPIDLRPKPGVALGIIESNRYTLRGHMPRHPAVQRNPQLIELGQPPRLPHQLLSPPVDQKQGASLAPEGLPDELRRPVEQPIELHLSPHPRRKREQSRSRRLRHFDESSVSNWYRPYRTMIMPSSSWRRPAWLHGEILLERPYMSKRLCLRP